MSRMIDAEVLTKRLVEFCKKNCPYTAKARDIMCGSCFMGIALETVEDAPPIEPEQRWIPVDLRNNSPEENKVVLLGVRCRDDFKYFVTSRQDYNYWTGLGREIKGELRWQPLPEPYREEGGM